MTVGAGRHALERIARPGGEPSVPHRPRACPVSSGPYGMERSNAFAADNSTEWTGGARNLAPETALDDKTIRSYLFAPRHCGPWQNGLGAAASRVHDGRSVEKQTEEDLYARGHADDLGDNRRR